MQHVMTVPGKHALRKIRVYPSVGADVWIDFTPAEARAVGQRLIELAIKHENEED